MSVQPRSQGIPEETQRVARAAHPKGNVYMRMRDELGDLYLDEEFANLFAERGQPAKAPGQLVWVTIMQFAEGLSDREAAEAIQDRVSWKYVLGLELTDPGFDYSVLSEFRGRLLRGGKEEALLDILLQALKEKGLLKAGGRQRTDSTHVLAAVRMLNRLELVGETMRQALNELAEVAPEWVREMAPPEWFLRYSQRFDSLRSPKEPTERKALMEVIGGDGFYLYAALKDSPFQDPWRWLPGVEILRQVWIQQYWVENLEDGTRRVRLRDDENQPPGAQRIASPYDVEARYSMKRNMEWMGYKVHFTETCDDENVHLITHVETTESVKQDVDMGGTIHTALAEKGLLPGEHLMDAGYIDAELLVSAQRDMGVAVCGPVRKDVHWQARARKGFDSANFQINWEARSVTCPQGIESIGWSEGTNAFGQPVVVVRFKTSVCRDCSSRKDCTRSKQGPRQLVFRPRAEHEALQEARKTQETSAFWKQYAKRSGIEGTISQAVNVCDVRRARYIGLAKTHLQMIATAVAINLHRLFDWWTEAKRSVTRISQFARLAPNPTLLAASWHP